MSETISVTTSDDVTMSVPREIVLMWCTVADLLEDCAPPKKEGDGEEEKDGEGEEEEEGDAPELRIEDVPITDVESATLERIVEFCQQYLADPKGVEWKKKYFDVPSTDDSLEYIQARNRVLAEITAGANFLNIAPLYKEVTAAIASTFKDKTPEQIRDEWGWDDDLTDDQKERIIQENAWCLDL